MSLERVRRGHSCVASSAALARHYGRARSRFCGGIVLFYALTFFVVIGVIVLARFGLAVVHHSANHICIGLTQLLIGIRDFIATSKVLANNERRGIDERREHRSINERSNGRVSYTTKS